MRNVPKTTKKAVRLREESEGVGMVVENVAWGPQGLWVLTARLFGWVVRMGLVAMGLPCVVLEMKAWQEVGYPWLLQCFLYVLCTLGAVALVWLLATNPSQVRKGDVLQVSPKEGVTWTWCSHCRLLRPPGAIHCFLCHCCIDCIHHHCVALWRCVGKKSLPAFITVLGVMATIMFVNFVMIKEPTVSFRGTLGNYVIAFSVLFLLIHSILSLDDRHPWSPPQVYPSNVFVVRACRGHSGKTPFTFCFSDIPSRRGQILRMVFRPLFSEMIQPKHQQIKDLPQCPNSKCRALANPYWLTGGSDGIVECNMCEAVFPLPQDTKGALLDRDFLTCRDVHCLLDGGRAHPRPRLVFVLDSSVSEVQTLIHSWATATHGLPDVEMLCYETRTSYTYVGGDVLKEEAAQCYSLGVMVDRGRREVAAHGGRLVFVSSRERHGLEMDALEALIVAASQVSLDLVCISKLGVEMNPLLQPLVLHHQALNGGWTRVLERPRDVLRLVRSGVFVFWGVRARGRVQWTKGVEVVRVFGRGVTPTRGQGADSFSMASLHQGKGVEFNLMVNPATVQQRRRLSDPEDNTVYFQLKLMYTTRQGKAALSVYNRAFSVN